MLIGFYYKENRFNIVHRCRSKNTMLLPFTLSIKFLKNKLGFISILSFYIGYHESQTLASVIKHCLEFSWSFSVIDVAQVRI